MMKPLLRIMMSNLLTAKQPNKKQISITLTKAMLDQIDSYKVSAGINRSIAIERLLYAGLVANGVIEESQNGEEE